MNRRRAIRRRYKNIFYVKQQLKIFYGKQKEHRFSRFFKQHLNNLARRNLSFSASLERRADIVLFRLRFLPTIYACQQYIHHYGLLINDKKEQSPYALVVPGDIISFEEPI
jgi:small subunit ribosomal protein S4